MNLNEAVTNFVAGLHNSESNLFAFNANKKTKFDPESDSVYYSGPFWDDLEVTAAIETLLKGQWLTSGARVNQFEGRFSKKFGFNDSVMVNSGSSANLVMIAALKKHFGWNDGDEIIVSVVGFPTTTSAIIQNNLKPVFVDVTWEDLNWDLEKVKSAISNKTRAVFSSPVLGNPYNFDELLGIVTSAGIKLISDNCDSLGSKWRGKFLTEYSVAASCSFYPAHHICTMEGGMVSSLEPEIIKIARSFAWWGRACYCVGKQNLLACGTCKERFSNWIPELDVPVDHKYVFENIGYNLKPLDLQGAIGLVQLDKIDEIERLRRENKLRLDEILSLIPGCRVVTENPNATTSWFGAPIICETSALKSSLVKFFEDNRVQTRNYFAGNLLLQPGYKHLGNWRDYPIASEVLSRVFFLGVSPTITSEMLDYVEKVVRDFIDTFPALIQKK
jgi:CDP-6-deoxy-D-xylo-4-hexulose-3-dehydrase